MLSPPVASSVWSVPTNTREQMNTQMTHDQPATNLQTLRFYHHELHKLIVWNCPVVQSGGWIHVFWVQENQGEEPTQTRPSSSCTPRWLRSLTATRKGLVTLFILSFMGIMCLTLWFNETLLHLQVLLSSSLCLHHWSRMEDHTGSSER